MEESESPDKRPTTRRRSSYKILGSPATFEKSNSPLNGKDEQEKNEKEIHKESDDAQSENEVKETLQSTKRKRKASEMKLQDKTDEPPTKDKLIEIKEEKVVSTDSEMEVDEMRAIENALKSDSDEMNLPERQVFGKGKRARIPNKRYSDFPLTHSKSKLSSSFDHIDQVQNGIKKENIEAESSSTSDLSGSRSSQTNSPSVHKSTKESIDITNPEYLKPFEYGWKRELVYRSTSNTPNKRNGDIYYYTPSGKKVRSMREVAENLKDRNLTLNNFTFFKEPIGLNDPEKEIVRDAKVKPGFGSINVAKKSSTVSPRITKPKSTTASPAPAPSTAEPTPESKETDNKEIKEKEIVKKQPREIKETPMTPTDSVSSKAKKNSGIIKVKMTTSTPISPKLKAKGKQKKKEEELQMGTLPPTWQSPKKSPTRTSNDVDKRCQPCTILCQGVSGPIPNLQCHICLCLYHHECVGLSPHISILQYVCKNCQVGPSGTPVTTSAVGPPTLPLSQSPPLATNTNIPAALPKLQRILKPNEMVPPATIASKPPPLKPAPTQPDIVVNSDLPKLTPKPGIMTPMIQKAAKTAEVAHSTVSESKSIVGSVTTWFPSSSTIQVSQNSSSVANSNTQPPPRPQFVEYFGNKKYLVIPKHNVVSVSPTVATTATTPPNKPINNGDNLDEKVLNTATEAVSTAATPSGEIAEIAENIDTAVKNQSGSPSSCNETKSPLISDNIPEINKSSGTLFSNADHQEDVANIQENEASRGDETDLEAIEGKRTSKRIFAKSTLRNAESPKSIKLPEKHLDMDNFLQNLSFGYKTLLCVFQYLKMQDLLRASCVCKMWRDIASHPSLWHTVRMKNSQIHSFEGLADALQIHGTVHLDLRKMLLPGNGDEIWPEFSRAIKKVDTLRKIELCRCPANVVEQIASSNPKLEVINAVTIKCDKMDLAPLIHLNNLQELRLKSTAGVSLTSDLTALSQLSQLKHLSLTSIKELNKINIEVIAGLTNLVSLELGECLDFPKNFGEEILSKLIKLEKLRLEKGQGSCNTFEILEAVKEMPLLDQLELVNFDIKPGFDKALGLCKNIKKLLIIPTYVSQSATTNHMVLGGVLRLQSTLLHFVWGVTLELLRVTELFVDQCEDQEKRERKEKRGNGDSIPVLKPVPLLKDGQSTLDIPPAQDPPQVEILPLPNLQKLLLQSLPTTRVKILKIPFHATWRQSITDTVN